MASAGELANELAQKDCDVAIDPFLIAKTTSCGAGLVREQQYEDVAFDPFLIAETNYGSFRPTQKRDSRYWKTSPQDIIDGGFHALGPGDSKRTSAGWYLLVILPSVMFALVELQWLFVCTHSFEACAYIAIILAAGLISLTIINQRQLHSLHVSPMVLGVLGLVAVTAGTATGIQGWHLHWRQISWNFIGSLTSPTSAATPALARSDAGTINFWPSESLQYRMNSTSVDATRAAGYKDGQIYCAAPIMSPATVGELALVNFWAIGTSCCRPSGSFTCDGSRDPGAGYGVVILRDGAQHFSQAVQKAEAAHRLVSAEGALLVRWTSNPNRIKAEMLLHGLIFVSMSFLSAFAVFASAGSSAWYLGLRPHLSLCVEKALP